MNEYELKARNYHKDGNNCSNAVYLTFKDVLDLKEQPPMPRSIDGICGTVLTTEYVLRCIGKEDLINEFRNEFISKFKYIKCLDLMKNGRKCNDYVGFAARFISEHLKKS